MTPPRSVLRSWRALEAAERVRAEFDRRIGDLEELSAAVRAECHRLDGDGWQGAAFDAVLAIVEASHHHNRILCDQAEGLRDAGVRALSDLHYTALALLDYVADAEADGCAVAEDWTVTAESTVGAEWAEVIGEAVAAVERAEQRGRQAILAVGHELRHLAEVFARDLGLDGPPSSPGPDMPERPGDTSATDTPAASNDRPGDAARPGPGAGSPTQTAAETDRTPRPGDPPQTAQTHDEDPEIPADRPEGADDAPFLPEPGTNGGDPSVAAVPAAVGAGQTIPAAESVVAQHVPSSGAAADRAPGPDGMPPGPEPGAEIGGAAPPFVPPPAPQGPDQALR